jgi:DNA mismatch endonuclease, patch repair protein
VVNINGCFWHQHLGCKNAVIPKSNVDFWQKKLTATIVRDEFNNSSLRLDGWNVFNIWECEIESDLAAATKTILNALEK